MSLIWKSDFWTTCFNHSAGTRPPRAEGLLDEAKDFMLDRLDDALEPIARGGWRQGQWATNERRMPCWATKSRSGAMRSVLAHISRLVKGHPDCELHLVGPHCAGAVLQRAGGPVAYVGRQDQGRPPQR